MGRQERKEWVLAHPGWGALVVGVFFTAVMVLGVQVDEADPDLLLAAVISLPGGLVFGAVLVVTVRRQELRERGLAHPTKRELRQERERRDRQAGW